MFGYAGYGMMGGGFLGPIIALAVLIDLVLFGIWLWQRVNKK